MKKTVSAALLAGVTALMVGTIALYAIGAVLAATYTPQKDWVEPIPTWWINGESMPPGWDCGQADGGACH